MKSNLEPLKTKKDDKKIKLSQVQEIALIWQAIIIVAVIISFIMSRYIVELSLLMNLYLVILSFIMAYTNYTIYKKKSITFLYLIFGIIILGSIIVGVLA